MKRASVAQQALLCALFSAVAQAQTDEEKISALCRNSDASPLPASHVPTISQTESEPLSITLSTGSSGASALWLHDEDGELIAFSDQVASGTVTFDISNVQPRLVTAYAHYGEPLCHVAASEMTYTYDGEIDRYMRRTDNYGDSWWPAEVEEASRPRVTVDYAAKSATLTMQLFVGKPVPFAFLRGSWGQLLAFGHPPVPTTNTTYTLTATNLPTYDTAYFGCAPLGGEVICSENQITSVITAHLRSEHPLSSTPLVPDASLTSVYALRLAPTSGDTAACASTSGEGYVAWAELDGAVVAFSHGSPLTVEVGAGAGCDYEAGGSNCVVTVFLLCGSLRSASVDVASLPPASGSAPSGTLTDNTPLRCETQHPGRDTSWLDPKTGMRCECFNGVAECGGFIDQTWYFGQREAAMVAAASMVMLLVLLVFCAYLRVKHRKAMDTPIEGAQRRSLILPGKNDYVKSRRSHLRGEEVELPAPPTMAGGGVVVTRETMVPEGGDVEMAEASTTHAGIELAPASRHPENMEE